MEWDANLMSLMVDFNQVPPPLGLMHRQTYVSGLYPYFYFYSGTESARKSRHSFCFSYLRGCWHYLFSRRWSRATTEPVPRHITETGTGGSVVNPFFTQTLTRLAWPHTGAGIPVLDLSPIFTDVQHIFF